MDFSTSDPDRVHPSLETLPPELRKLIVSFLAPTHLQQGCKQALKNANLAHRCLHDWATEYLFHDMVLVHAVPGMASHLELFAAHPHTAGFQKYVKRVIVQVPPALRWEVGHDGPIFSREALTRERLYTALGVQSTDEMTDAQRLFCQRYHRAMVEPFINNQRWMQLVISAGHAWRPILANFVNLETVEVASCGRADHPWGTSTHSFVLKHGKSVVNKESPPYVEDDTINKGWASILLAQLPTQNVRNYHLTWAQTDNLNSFATVNRLLTMGYDLGISLHKTMTRLVLTLEGVYGTHGSRDWHGNTGTAGGVRFWKRSLNGMINLQSLTLRNRLDHNEDRMFTNQAMTDTHGNVIDWLLPGLINNSLRTLLLDNFEFDKSAVADTLKAIGSPLTTLTLTDCTLVDREEDDDSTNAERKAIHHIQGHTWLELCQDLSTFRPEMRLKLIRPLSDIDFRPHDTIVEQLRQCGVSLELSLYPAWVKVPPEQPKSALCSHTNEAGCALRSRELLEADHQSQ